MIANEDAVKPYVLSVVRRLLQASGLWLVHHGYFTSGQWTEVVGGLAGILTVEGFILLAKIRTNKKIMAALTLPPTASMAQIETVAKEVKA